MDYIYIKQHLDNDPKIQRFIRNRILYQTSDTQHYADYKRKMNQSFDQSIHQTTLQKYNDLSFLVIDKLRQSPTRKSCYSRPTSATQRSPYIFQSNFEKLLKKLSTLRNLKLLEILKEKQRVARDVHLKYTCRQYKVIL